MRSIKSVFWPVTSAGNQNKSKQSPQTDWLEEELKLSSIQGGDHPCSFIEVWTFWRLLQGGKVTFLWVGLHWTRARSLFSQFSRSVVSDSLWPHGLQHARLPCPSPTPEACSNSCPLSQWCHPTERLLLNHANTPGFLAPGGEEFNPGPETRLDCSELLCNKVFY